MAKRPRVFHICEILFVLFRNPDGRLFPSVDLCHLSFVFTLRSTLGNSVFFLLFDLNSFVALSLLVSDTD